MSDFMDRAEAQAERQIPDPASWVSKSWQREAFMAGAEWAWRELAVHDREVAAYCAGYKDRAAERDCDPGDALDRIERGES